MVVVVTKINDHHSAPPVFGIKAAVDFSYTQYCAVNITEHRNVISNKIMIIRNQYCDANIVKTGSGYLGQPTTRTDRQDGERLLKLSDLRLVLELGAIGGHFEHSQ